jgi:hypothetical protein
MSQEPEEIPKRRALPEPLRLATTERPKSSLAQIVQAFSTVSILVLGILGFIFTVRPLYQIGKLQKSVAELEETKADLDRGIQNYRAGMRPLAVDEFTKKVLLDSASLLVAADRRGNSIKSGTGSSSWSDPDRYALDFYRELGILNDRDGAKLGRDAALVTGVDVIKEHLKGAEMKLLDDAQRSQLSARILELTVAAREFDTILTFRDSHVPYLSQRSALTPDQEKAQREAVDFELKRLNDAHLEFAKAVVRLKATLLL